MAKKRSPIKIKPENVGKFTKWCKRHGYPGATHACEEEGLASRLASVRKQAQFSRNAKSWKKG